MDNKTFIQQDWVKQKIISRLTYNPDTGDLTWSKRGVKWFDDRYFGKSVGQKWIAKDGYKQATTQLGIKGRKVSVVTSRLCWLVHTGDWPKETIDHINKDSWDNRFSNLRDVSQGFNNSNKGFYKGRVFKHVSFKTGSWVVRYDGKYLGEDKCLGRAIKLRDDIFTENGWDST